MAQFVNAPGTRDISGIQNLASQYMAQGQEAVSNRQEQGAMMFQLLKDEADRRNVSMKWLLDQDPRLAQSMQGAALSMSRGDKNMAYDMYNSVASLDSDPIQLLNEKIFDDVNTFRDRDLYDKKISEGTGEYVKNIVQQGTVDITPEVIANVKDSVAENAIWGNIFGAAGVKPQGYDENGIPIWDARDTQNSIVAAYLPGETWDSIKGDTAKKQAFVKAIQDTPTAPTTVIEAVQKGAVVDEQGEVTYPAGSSNLPEGAVNVGIMSQLELGLPETRSIERGRPETAAPVQEAPRENTAGLGQKPLVGWNPEDRGGQGVVTPGPETAQRTLPQSFGTVPTFKEVTGEEIVAERTEKGYAHMLEDRMNLLKEQAPINMQKSFLSDQEIRDAEANINLKEGQVEQYKANYLNSLAALTQASKEASPQQEEAIGIVTDQYNELIKEQSGADFTKNLSNEEYRKSWTARVNTFKQSLLKNGFGMDAPSQELKDGFLGIGGYKVPLLAGIYGLNGGMSGAIPQFGEDTNLMSHINYGD